MRVAMSRNGEGCEEETCVQVTSPTDRYVRFRSDDVDVSNPDVRSKSWVEEEGEIFRKGTVLLGPEEMEGEYAGEDLRREVCLTCYPYTSQNSPPAIP
jgi:hypothetical protein